MAARDRGHVYVDKDGSVHYSGNAVHAEEWEERALLGFMPCTAKEQRQAFAPRLKNHLFDRAWTLCHKQKELSAARLQELIVSGEDGPEKAVREITRVVRKSCENVAPLQKHKAFLDFFRRGQRRSGEPIGDCIQRRSDAYERLVDLTNGKTTASERRLTIVLLDGHGQESVRGSWVRPTTSTSGTRLLQRCSSNWTPHRATT